MGVILTTYVRPGMILQVPLPQVPLPQESVATEYPAASAAVSRALRAMFSDNKLLITVWLS